ncbi:MAG: alpha/beta hydrolase fold family protein [Bradyrhizobium sp.]|nr:alpha/beta hydrolase fold family protein [Bradyrhizobium sp.]
MEHTHVTVATQYIEAGGIRFAYRRFGQGRGMPLVLIPHFRAGMDHWDPAVTDGLAAGRPVILFDNAGVSGSSGETPGTIEAMADDAATFIAALELVQADVLGFSIGGYIAQALALRHPAIVRRLVLVGTGPREGETASDPKVGEYGASTDLATGESSLEAFLYLFFNPSETSQNAGRAFWERRHRRTVDVDLPTTPQTMTAQRAAITAWRDTRGAGNAELGKVAQPTLVVNGSHDIMIPTINAFTLSQVIPDAQLILYPDSGHGSLFQFPERFVAHTSLFLAAD